MLIFIIDYDNQGARITVFTSSQIVYHHSSCLIFCGKVELLFLFKECARIIEDKLQLLEFRYYMNDLILFFKEVDC